MLFNLPLISVNLLTYNGKKYIKACLDSVLAQSYPNVEILIIDNASTDRIENYLKSLPTNDYRLRLIFNQKNVGFAAGHNQGIKESRGEFILCLNQDVVLDKDFVKKAIEVLEEDDKIAAVQGKLLRFPGAAPILGGSPRITHIDTTGLVILKNRRIISRGQGQIDEGQYESSEEIFGADGAAPVYRRNALEDIKINGEYFDEDFFCYKEDVDSAWRLRLYGWKTIYQPEAAAWHRRGAGDSAATNYFKIIQERLKINKFAKYLSFKNQRLMQIKNEQVWLLLKHLPWFLPKEIAAWIYVILFERHAVKAIKDLFKQMPGAWQKRRVIMAKKRVVGREMERWFR